MDKSRVLILSTAYLPHIGGSELAIKNITERLTDFEFDLITARLDKNTPEHENIGNVSVYRVGGSLVSAGFLLPKIFLPLSVFFKARKLIRNNNYLAVHAYQASGAAGAGWLLKIFYPHTHFRQILKNIFLPWQKSKVSVGIFTKLPFIVTLQEGKNLEEQGFLINFFRGMIIKKADRATAISGYLKEYIFKTNHLLKTDLIPNGVDIQSFSKKFSYGEMTELDERLGIMPDDKVVISASRFVPKNGLDLLIKAFWILNRSAQANYKLLLVGDGSQKTELAGIAETLGISNKVIFAGTVDNQDLPLYLKISDVFVRPSRSEGLGSAFLEAMAAEVPIIGTRVGGIPDFLKDRKTGLFSTFEPEDIAFKIRIILENDKLKEDLVRNAADLVREKYDWDKIAEDFRKLYSNL